MNHWSIKKKQLQNYRKINYLVNFECMCMYVYHICICTYVHKKYENNFKAFN